MSADRLAEIKARAEAATPEDVPWLVEQVERAEAEVEWWKERFPCDGLCSDAPEEDCSRHGRSPADLWRIISEVAAERDALAQEAEVLRAKVAAVEALVDSNPDHADTCGSVLTPGAGYPCSCWQADLRAALATTGEGQ